MKREIFEIMDKAQYISDLALGIMTGNVREAMPQELINDIYNQLANIADTLDEYHSFGEDE